MLVMHTSEGHEGDGTEHSGRKNGTSKLKRKRKRIKNATIEFKWLGHLSCVDDITQGAAAPNTSSTSIFGQSQIL